MHGNAQIKWYHQVFLALGEIYSKHLLNQNDHNWVFASCVVLPIYKLGGILTSAPFSSLLNRLTLTILPDVRSDSWPVPCQKVFCQLIIHFLFVWARTHIPVQALNLNG